MINPHISERRAVPIWAALGAPLIGVPLMVALLALVAPAQRPAGELDEGYRAEWIEVQPVDRSFDVRSDCGTPSPRRG